MPTTKPGKDQGNVALPKIGKPFTSKHSQDLLRYNAVDDHASQPMSKRGPLDKGHPMKKYGDPMKKYGAPLTMAGYNPEHAKPDKDYPDDGHLHYDRTTNTPREETPKQKAKKK
jgi:hypothetical protein